MLSFFLSLDLHYVFPTASQWDSDPRFSSTVVMHLEDQLVIEYVDVPVPIHGDLGGQEVEVHSPGYPGC